MTKVKVIANYLPQFHVIPENNLWWGEGYTDWVGVQLAEPQFKGHCQPRIPLGKNYYSLDDAKVIQWQAELAKKYDVYGFGIYHYWFSSDLRLLHKPAEILLSNPDIDIHYMFIWDNSSWTRTWSRKGGNDWTPQFDNNVDSIGQNSGVLAELCYGTEKDWEQHFYYLLPFFKDKRYIRLNGKPMFAFFQPSNNFSLQKRMVAYWEKLAIKEGLPGLICLSKDNPRGTHFEYSFRYSPFSPNNFLDGLKNKIRCFWTKKRKKIRLVDYDEHWQSILADAKKAPDKVFLSGFVSFDDTPRRGVKARVICGSTPVKFKKYMKELIDISKMQNKEYLFLTAWNEWGEGAYLEPDEHFGFEYLKSLKSALAEMNV